MKMGCLSSLREEFRLKQLGFSGVNSDRFYHSQWRVPVSVYLLYRVLIATYTLFWLGYVDQGADHGWGAYLTNWTYTLLNVYFASHCLVVVVFHCMTLFGCRHGDRATVTTYCFARPDPRSDVVMLTNTGAVGRSGGEGSPTFHTPLLNEVTAPETLPWYLCVVWVVFNAVSSAAVLVTIVYFIFLFPGGRLSLVDTQVHLMNSLLMLLEHAITAVPYRLLHVIYPVIYGLIYVIFSVIYWAGDHSRVLYKDILDWNQPGQTVGCIVLIAVVVVPLLHGVFFACSKAKSALSRWG